MSIMIANVATDKMIYQPIPHYFKLFFVNTRFMTNFISLFII